MASYRNDIEHRVVIRPIEPGDGFEVVHERRRVDLGTRQVLVDFRLQRHGPALFTHRQPHVRYVRYDTRNTYYYGYGTVRYGTVAVSLCHLNVAVPVPHEIHVEAVMALEAAVTHPFHDFLYAIRLNFFKSA